MLLFTFAKRSVCFAVHYGKKERENQQCYRSEKVCVYIYFSSVDSFMGTVKKKKMLC